MRLYERWLETVEAFRDEMAVREACGRVWSFGELAGAVEGMERVAEAVVVRGGGAGFLLRVLQGWRNRVAVVPVDSGDFSVAEELPDWVGHVKVTSGSTGAAKVVLFREDQLAADADAIVATMGLRRDCPNVGAISMAHSYGFSNLVTPLFLHGIPLVLAENPLPEAMRTAVAGLDAVTLPAVPAMWKAWRAAGVIDGRVKLAISAGAPLGVELERAVFEETGVKVHNFLGASECGGIAYDRSDVPREDETFVGEALAGVDVRVGEGGCLEVRGDSVGECYLGGESGALGGGVYRTEDQVRVHEDRVFLLGRAGDVINVAGRKVGPGEIEAVVGSSVGVRHCVVFGVPSGDPGRVDDVVVCLSLEDGVDVGEVERAVRERLDGWKVPRRWVVDAGVVPDVRGKISRAKWRGRFLNDGVGDG